MSRHSLSIFAAAVLYLAVAIPASGFTTSGKSLIIMDYGTGAVLAEKNADIPLPPASMSKLMTLYMAFEALDEGRLSLDNTLPVSRHAASYDGSSMFLKPGERVTVEDLLRGVVVLSGNDASAVLAEALSPDGTEEGFARQMTEHAPEIGLTNSVFANSNGWPDDRQKMSARDLAILASRLIRDFPVHYLYFAEKEFLFDQRVPENRYNRNPLLQSTVGADGLKTGYTRDSGYGLVGSAKRGDRRVVFVLAGLNSRSARSEEADRIVNWFFIQFSQKEIFAADETVISAPVWMGSSDEIRISVPENANILLPASSKDMTDVTAIAVLDQHLEAPIAKGAQVGKLTVTVTPLDYQAEFPLVAAESVERAGYLGAFGLSAKTLFQKYVVDNLPFL